MYSSVTVSRGISGAIKMVRLVNSRSSGLPRVCTTGQRNSTAKKRASPPYPVHSLYARSIGHIFVLLLFNRSTGTEPIQRGEACCSRVLSVSLPLPLYTFFSIEKSLSFFFFLFWNGKRIIKWSSPFLLLISKIIVD